VKRDTNFRKQKTWTLNKIQVAVGGGLKDKTFNPSRNGKTQGN
jgi:hypothetical protein